MQLNINAIKKLLDESFIEDIGIKGDITSDAIVDNNKIIKFSIVAREQLVLAGIPIAQYYLNNYSSIKYKTLFTDSVCVEPEEKIITGQGYAKEILLLERIILNFMQHLSGVATLTNNFVQEIAETNAQIYDTRKTIPGLRRLQKYAVVQGGGNNHRLTMDSSILIKDNHIVCAGSIENALKAAKSKSPHYAKIEVECDNIQQVQEALDNAADIIMLDNMSITELQNSVDLIDGRAIIEASGGANINNALEIAQTGVNIISVGQLTHSAKAADIGLDM
jgi:nicotinate-nucleotide pyrophosphorylase (carboxylating)